jgi:hypothetical protein
LRHRHFVFLVSIVLHKLAALLLLALLQPAPPPFTAHWQGAHVARIVWQQPKGVHLTCISRNATLIRCWTDLPAETYIMLLGNKGPLDAAYHPAVGDVFVLQQDGQTWRAPLRGVVRLAVIRG